MVQVYRNKWKRPWYVAIACYLRDSVIIHWPTKKVPLVIVKLLYGFVPDFAFLVHPRTYQDIFISMPFYSPIKLFFREEQAYTLFNLTSPFVVSSVKTTKGVNGIVVGQPTVPEFMANNRHETLRILKLSLRLVAKISREAAIVGLGGWYPAMTRRGAALKPTATSLGLRITNGHCGTLASLYMTIKKSCSLANVSLGSLNVAVIGVGKMGLNVAKVLAQEVKCLTLVDVNKQNIEKATQILKELNPKLEIVTFDVLSDKRNIKTVLKGTALGVCATSNVRNALKLKDLPLGYLMIDDSRPEALPRDGKLQRIILEGGLLKARGVQVNYDFGFGEGDNVFGCLGESYVLSLDTGRSLDETLSHVDSENFKKFLDFCSLNEVGAGDFLSKDIVVPDDLIIAALKKDEEVLN